MSSITKSTLKMASNAAYVCSCKSLNLTPACALLPTDFNLFSILFKWQSFSVLFHTCLGGVLTHFHLLLNNSHFPSAMSHKPFDCFDSAGKIILIEGGDGNVNRCHRLVQWTFRELYRDYDPYPNSGKNTCIYLYTNQIISPD